MITTLPICYDHELLCVDFVKNMWSCGLFIQLAIYLVSVLLCCHCIIVC